MLGRHVQRQRIGTYLQEGEGEGAWGKCYNTSSAAYYPAPALQQNFAAREGRSRRGSMHS